MSSTLFTEIQSVSISQVPTPQLDTPQVADYSQSIFIAVTAIASFLLGASKTYLTILPFARRILPKQWTDRQVDEYLEALASCIIQLSPSLSQVDKTKIKDKIANPTETAKLVLAEPEKVVEKLGKQIIN
jgi:hypothetical protein